jgi:hypothetical protein
MDPEVRQAILLAIDALESCVLATFIDDSTEQEWEAQEFDEGKVKAALKALQGLPWEEDVDTKPEPLRLADFLESQFGLSSAAAEMRRLHAVNKELLEALITSARQLEADAIFMSISGASGNQQAEAALIARAAIAKATGEKA